MSFVETNEIERYKDDGYCLAQSLIPLDLMEPARARVLDMVENQPEWKDQSWQIMDPASGTNSKGETLPAGIQGPSKHEEVFNVIAKHPNIVEAMTDILGGEVEFFTDQIGLKHGFVDNEQGMCSYYHQDSYYWNIEPNQGANCWIPFQEVGPDNIALAVKPGTQRGWKLHEHETYNDDPTMGHMSDGNYHSFKRNRIPLADVDFSDEIIYPMNTGDGLFFSNYTWHRSDPNRSGEDRLFYGIAYRLKQNN
ncbi:MAG: phytanoyl-CoA dioxygenase family protein [Lentisphaeria bacterium]|nr:phytanoyl-CoA dioxygenase family protein [Lentisphaeria bacterium]